MVGALVGGRSLAACGGDPAPPVADDGSSVTRPEPAAGPVPVLPVDPTSAAASPLPEVAARRLDGEGGWVQFRNELPPTSRYWCGSGHRVDRRAVGKPPTSSGSLESTPTRSG